VGRVPSRDAQLLGAQKRGWHLVLFPAFREPLLALAADVARLRQRDPNGWTTSAKAMLLKRILEVILDEIPHDPASPTYEQGNTLGADARGWRRAKFLSRFRLFFRFDSRSKVIVYAWVNDENTLRKAGAASDPYAVFRAMLVAGSPPHDWARLLEARGTAGDTAQISEIEALLGPMAPIAVEVSLLPKRPRRRR